MKDIFQRLYRIGKAVLPRPKWMEKFVGPGISDEEFYEKFREFYGHGPWDDNGGHKGNDSGYRSDKNHDGASDEYSGSSQQVADDLAVFNLRPPSSLAEVKKARNREIRKYHSDHFMNDPEKYETSKKIMQIYNAAYERLKKHFDTAE
ncbi:MAG: J domain-containing protein [Desulfococcaceae bacterium]|jgi:hypothetical protein|nr:J domain-containing protein [Desulfococcaceae bacterium]